jgi:hypothetical protein
MGLAGGLFELQGALGGLLCLAECVLGRKMPQGTEEDVGGGESGVRKLTARIHLCGSPVPFDGVSCAFR